MINRCIGCYYHDCKENVCTHGSPIFLDDVCTDYQDSEFVMQIKAEATEEFATDIINIINFADKWLFERKSNNADINIAFDALRTFVRSKADQLKEQNK